jgi:hypothetical protein
VFNHSGDAAVSACGGNAGDKAGLCGGDSDGKSNLGGDASLSADQCCAKLSECKNTVQTLYRKARKDIGLHSVTSPRKLRSKSTPTNTTKKRQTSLLESLPGSTDKNKLNIPPDS